MIADASDLVDDVEAVRVVRDEAIPDFFRQGLACVGRRKTKAGIAINQQSIVLCRTDDVPQERGNFWSSCREPFDDHMRQINAVFAQRAKRSHPELAANFVEQRIHLIDISAVDSRDCAATDGLTHRQMYFLERQWSNGRPFNAVRCGNDTFVKKPYAIRGVLLQPNAAEPDALKRGNCPSGFVEDGEFSDHRLTCVAQQCCTRRCWSRGGSGCA